MQKPDNPAKDLPENVYYSLVNDNFYGALQIGCGHEFYNKWQHRKGEFPQSYEAMIKEPRK